MLRKWSQARLGAESKLHSNYIGEIERAEKQISAVRLVHIAKALKIPVALLFIEGAYRMSAAEIEKGLREISKLK